MSDLAQSAKYTNRLARESSPYLLQHAHNPVDWYAWGPEAFEAARNENKPIFLSVGYSTCYWCHVMERECFENEAIAAEMNRRFINIKVDREERPDVDQLYMLAVQVLTRHGGWPMSVFMSPDLRPFYGGTYFPPTDMHGRPGFVTVLRGIEDAYQNRPADVARTSDQLSEMLAQFAEPAGSDTPIEVNDAFIDELIQRSTSDYDSRFGGFGGAPKFPRETLLELLLVYTQSSLPADDSDKNFQREHIYAVIEQTIASDLQKHFDAGNANEFVVKVDRVNGQISATRAGTPVDSKIVGRLGAHIVKQMMENFIREDEREKFKPRLLKMLRHTLDALAEGGIRDQLGGGFHRYSTDAHWLVPHFEIMLYDNAMLAWCYVEAYRQTRDPQYQAVARGIFDFALREMTSPQGLFYTAFDAEVDSQEGLNYLWTKDEVEKLLQSSLGTGDAERKVIDHFLKVYGLDRGPNFADPHHGSGVADKNILYLATPTSASQAEGEEPKSALLDPELAPLRRILYDARQKRKQPLLDTKIITSWNALMIRALAYGGHVLNEPGYIDAAVRAAGSLLATHRTQDGGLYRTSRDGAVKYRGFLDDYAFLIQALLALADATGDRQWNAHATALAATMTTQFGNSANGGFYFSEKDAPDLIIRQKTASDSPLPSGNAIAAMALLELGAVAESRRALSLFARQVESQGEGMSAMVQAMLQHVRKAGPFSAGGVESGAGDDRPLSAHEAAHDAVAVRTVWNGTTELNVYLNIRAGFHIQAHDIAADLGLIVTTVSVIDDPAAQVEYPPGEAFAAGFTDRPIHVYSGEVKVVVRLSKFQQEGSKPKLRLTYQACDDSACLAPVTREI